MFWTYAEKQILKALQKMAKSGYHSDVCSGKRKTPFRAHAPGTKFL